MKYLLILLLLISCGTRKASLTKYDIKVDSISIDNKRILKHEIIFNDIYTITPFDSNKPVIINGKEYYNASIKYDKSKFDNFQIEDNTKIIEIKKDIVIKEKQTEKKDNSNLWIGIVFVVCLFTFLWFKTGK